MTCLQFFFSRPGLYKPAGQPAAPTMSAMSLQLEFVYHNKQMENLHQELKDKQATLDGYFDRFAAVGRDHRQLADLIGGYTSLTCEIARLTDDHCRSVDAAQKIGSIMTTTDFAKKYQKEVAQQASECAFEAEKKQAMKVCVEASAALKLEQSEPFDDYERKVRDNGQIQANTLMYCSHYGFGGRTPAIATYSMAYMLMPSTQRKGYWWIKLKNSEPELFAENWIYPIVE